MEDLPPWVSGIIGGVISGVISVAIQHFMPKSVLAPRTVRGEKILEFSLAHKIIFGFGFVVAPFVGFFAVVFAIAILFGEISVSPLMAVLFLIPIFLLLMAIGLFYFGYRVLFERVVFDDHGFTQSRVFPKWKRTVAWSEIEHADFNSVFRAYWLKPKSGRTFWYFGEMRGLDEFLTFVHRRKRMADTK